MQVTGSNAADGVSGGQDGAPGTNWDGLPVTAANGEAFTLPAYGDVLLNLNAGLLTDTTPTSGSSSQNRVPGGAVHRVCGGRGSGRRLLPVGASS